MICECEEPQSNYYKDVKSNGTFVVYKLCDSCGGYPHYVLDSRGYIHRVQYKHSELEIDLESIPIRKNYIREVCAVCGSSESVERHHFIPRSLINIPELKIKPEWGNYTVPLCHSCHYDDFHRIMTFFLYSFYTQDVAKIIKRKYNRDKWRVLNKKS